MKNLLLAGVLTSLILLVGPPKSLSQPHTVAYAYDAQGRLTSASYDSETMITYTYDDNNNLKAIETGVFNPVAIEGEADLPLEFALHPSHPNPFNPVATISFDVKNQVRVVLEVHNILGQKVATLIDRSYAPGRHQVLFDASNLPSGTYLYVIQMGDFRSVRKTVLLK